LAERRRGTAYATLNLDGIEQKALVTDRWKLIVGATSGGKALYDLGEAPFEATDRSRRHPERTEALFGSLVERSEASVARRRRLLPEGLDATAPAAELPLDSKRALQALGYIEADDEDTSR
jgi:hypothetical protein